MREKNVPITLYMIIQEILERLGASEFATLLSIIQLGVDITDTTDNPMVEVVIIT